MIAKIDKDKRQGIVLDRKGITIDFTNELGKSFELIGTYCNRADYKKAREEIDKIEPYCKTPADLARFHYSRGYVNSASVSQLLALGEYRKGLRVDPADTLNLKKECKYSRKLIEKEYAELRRIVVDCVHLIKQRYGEIPEENKAEVDVQTFQLLLGFHQSIRMPHADNIMLGFPKDKLVLGFEDYFAKLAGENRENAKRYLEEAYQITNRESFLMCIHNHPNLHLNDYIREVKAYLNDESAFDVNKLDDDGKLSFLATAEFVKAFLEYLPEAGIIAWDLSGQIGLLRVAFACDMIDKEDYCCSMDALTQVLRGKLSSFEEYARSFIFGSAVLVFKARSMNITKATDFMFSVMGTLCAGDLLGTKWVK